MYPDWLFYNVRPDVPLDCLCPSFSQLLINQEAVKLY